MRAVFFGTPALAVPSLLALAEVADIAGVVCQPDRPAGRGLQTRAPAVKQAALGAGFEVYQPERVRTGELESWLRARRPELALVLAYGRILPRPVLEVPARGCLNLHASLLPRYRGAAPIQWAIVHGESVTGISLMQMDEGMDTGPVYTRRSLAIGPEETAGELSERLAQLAAEVVRLDLAPALRGALELVAQDGTQATPAPPITRAQARIDFSAPARRVFDLIRGMTPSPGAHTTLRGKALKITRARPVDSPEPCSPGEVELRHERWFVGTGLGRLEVLRAQLEGRKELAAAELIRGRAVQSGDRLGTEFQPQ